jgi:hypothetical protein
VRRQTADGDGRACAAHVLEFAQGGNVDERFGRLDAALQLDEHVGAARDDAHGVAALGEDVQGLPEARRPDQAFPHPAVILGRAEPLLRPSARSRYPRYFFW